jgi:hypothetical protein
MQYFPCCAADVDASIEHSLQQEITPVNSFFIINVGIAVAAAAVVLAPLTLPPQVKTCSHLDPLWQKSVNTCSISTNAD